MSHHRRENYVVAPVAGRLDSICDEESVDSFIALP